MLHTWIDAKSPEAQAPRIAAPTKTDSTSLDSTTGLPAEGRARPLLGNKAAPANPQIIKTQKDKQKRNQKGLENHYSKPLSQLHPAVG